MCFLWKIPCRVAVVMMMVVEESTAVEEVTFQQPRGIVDLRQPGSHVPQGLLASFCDTTPAILLGLQPPGNSVLIVGGVVKE